MTSGHPPLHGRLGPEAWGKEDGEQHTRMFKNLSLDDLGVSGRQSERIELTLSNGFRGFNLDLVEFQQQVERHGLPHARRLIDSARLKPGSFKLPVEWQGSEETFNRDLA